MRKRVDGATVWRREGRMNDLMRRLLWLPVQASTFAADGRPPALLRHHGDDDRRRWSTGLLAFFFFFKYRERRPSQSTPLVIPSVPLRDRRHRRAAVLLPALVRPGLQGLRLVHDAAQEHDGRLRDGQEVDVEVRLSGDGPNAIGTLHVPADRPVRLLMTSRDVIHSFFVPDFRIKQDVLPGPLHRDLVRGDQAGPLPDPLRRVLRHLALADVGRGRGHAGARSSTSGCASSGPAWPSGSTPAATTVGRLPRLDRRVRQEGRDGRRAASSATRSTAQPHIGPTWLDLYRRRETLENGADGDRRRGLPHRFDDGPAREGREGLQAGDADLQGAARRRRRRPRWSSSSSRCAAPTSRIVPSKEAVYEPAKPARR